VDVAAGRRNPGGSGISALSGKNSATRRTIILPS
jgi:hypothetical protein